MAGYSGISMSNNARQAYAEGKKPVSRITKEDIEEHGIRESIAFFRWYVKKYCRSCEWHHSSPKYNMTSFYDIELCCKQLKMSNREALKAEYKSQSKPEIEKYSDEEPYYVKVEYSISTYTGRRKYLVEYAMIYKCWAYIDDDYKKAIIRKNINGKHFNITERYQSRPEGMSEDSADAILYEINKRTGS